VSGDTVEIAGHLGSGIRPLPVPLAPGVVVERPIGDVIDDDRDHPHEDQRTLFDARRDIATMEEDEGQEAPQKHENADEEKEPRPEKLHDIVPFR